MSAQDITSRYIIHTMGDISVSYGRSLNLCITIFWLFIHEYTTVLRWKKRKKD